MNQVNKTLYIPLYGKAWVSRQGIILRDAKAEEIWQKVRFPLAGKAKSKWLAYFMAMRARVFDDWAREKLKENPGILALHLGCGLDSRLLRLNAAAAQCQWYDVDFPAVIAERKKHYTESETCHMLAANLSEADGLDSLPKAEKLAVLLEGLSMYLETEQLIHLFLAIQKKCSKAYVLMDVYTELGAKASRLRNPANAVGVTRFHGVSGPDCLQINGGIRFAGEKSMTPRRLADQLKGFDKAFFSLLFAGKASGKLYRLFEYEIG